jgi:hypothetical protein
VDPGNRFSERGPLLFPLPFLSPFPPFLVFDGMLPRGLVDGWSSPHSSTRECPRQKHCTGGVTVRADQLEAKLVLPPPFAARRPFHAPETRPPGEACGSPLAAARPPRARSSKDSARVSRRARVVTPRGPELLQPQPPARPPAALDPTRLGKAERLRLPLPPVHRNNAP